jgi:hypothetical protein
MKKVLLTFFIVLTFSISFSWLSGFNYRIPITIKENSGKNLIDYQILITLNTQSLISAGKMRSDCGDIRFTDSDGISLLNYWLESGCNTQNTRIWVKVPSILARSTKTIYLYYGNSSATSLSNGDATFVFFENFDPNKNWVLSGKWHYTTYGVSLPASGRVLRYGNPDTDSFDEIANRGNADSPSFNLPPGCILEYVDRSATEYSGFTTSPYYDKEIIYISTDGGSTWTQISIYSGTWSWTTRSISISSYSSTNAKIRFRFDTVDGLYNNYYGWAIDNIRIRKYTSPEPTVSLGNEETNAPIWLQYSSSKTSIYVGESVNFASLWQAGRDANTYLSRFIFSWNATGTWINESYTFPPNSFQAWANVTKTINNAGRICWRFYANNSLNFWNATPISCIDVSLPKNPIWLYYNSSKTQVFVGESINFSSLWQAIYGYSRPSDWLSGFNYRIPITIKENSGKNLIDYQILITLNTQSLISAGKMRSDCGDIRFTDSDGISLLNYWIEPIITEVVIPQADDDGDIRTRDLDCSKNPSYKYYYCRHPCEPANWYKLNYDDSSWQTGYAPFAGYTTNNNFVFRCTDILNSAPDDLFVRKWFTINGIPISARLYLAYDDGIRCYINENLVIDALNEAHGPAYWNRIIDIPGNYLRQGNNLLACWVANGGENRGTGSGALDLKLEVTYQSCNSQNTKIWVKVPNIPASSTKTIYLYYGNPNANSLSNGNLVFDFFEDFERGTTGWNAVKYWDPDGTSTVSSATTTGYSSPLAGGVRLYEPGGGYASTGGLEKSLSITTGFYLTFNAMWSVTARQTNYDNFAIIVEATDGTTTKTVAYRFITGGSPCGYYWNAFSGSCGNRDYFCLLPNTWTTVSTDVKSDFSSLCGLSINRITKIQIAVGSYATTIYGYADNIIIRKYTSPEPTIILGNEEIYFQQNVYLSRFIFSWNATGTWINESYTFPPNSFQAWANVTKTINNAGRICWRFYANNSLNFWNATPISCIDSFVNVSLTANRELILKKGWNLISIPYKNFYFDLSRDECNLKEKIFHYFNGENWEYYTYREITYGKSYWVYSEKNCKIYLFASGNVDLNDLPKITEKNKKYGMIGSLAQIKNVTEIANIIGCKNAIVRYYDPEIGFIQTTLIKPWKGYIFECS